MKRNTQRRRGKSGRTPRNINSIAPLYRPYWTQIASVGVTTAGAYSNAFPILINQTLGSDFGGSTPSATKIGILRQAIFDFNPLTAPEGPSPNASNIDVQIGYQNVDGQLMYMTRAIPLSTTNRTTLSFKLPRITSEALLSSSSTAVLYVQSYNRANSTATSVPLYFTLETKWDLLIDAPKAI